MQMTIWDKLYNAIIFIISFFLLSIAVFFMILPLKVQFYVPFNFLFLVYDIVIIVGVGTVFICPRSFKMQKIFYRVGNGAWFFVCVFNLSFITCCLYWDMTWPMIYGAFRHIIPYWEDMVSL